MNITIDKNGRKLGPFTEDQVVEMLKSGELAPGDLGSQDGMAEWEPLSSFENLRVQPAQATPPPAGQATPPPIVQEIESITTGALFLGILSLSGWVLIIIVFSLLLTQLVVFHGIIELLISVGLCSGLFGIFAVILGHIGLKRIKRTGLIGGKNNAITGLRSGYHGIMLLFLSVAITVPLATASLERAGASQRLGNIWPFYYGIINANADRAAKGNKKIGFPADANLKSKAEVKQMLISQGYIMTKDVERLLFDKIAIGNVSESDPANTILLQYKAANGKTTVVMLKSG